MNPPGTDNLDVNMNKFEKRPNSRSLSTVTESVSLKPHEPYAEDLSMNKNSPINFFKY